MGFFDKRKLKVKVVSKGRIPPSHVNHFVIKGETRADERFEKVRWDAISIVHPSWSGASLGTFTPEAPISVVGSLNQPIQTASLRIAILSLA